MPETRFAIPYVSHLVITQRPLQSLKPTGMFNQQGQELARNAVDYPGITMELTTYIVTDSTSKKGPAQVFEFRFKKFWQDAKAELETLPTRNEQEQAALANITALLARTDVLWVEDALQLSNAGEFMSLWYDVFSDALDEFPSMNEEENIKGGIPLSILPMQWDIRVPYESNKVVTLKTGAFLGNPASANPEVIDLQFEDEQSKQNRVNMLAQYDSAITRLQAELDALESGTDAHRNKQQELTAYTTERARVAAVEYRTIGDLLQHPSVQTSLVQVLMGLIGLVKAKHFPEMDLAVVQQRLVAAIGSIR